MRSRIVGSSRLLAKLENNIHVRSRPQSLYAVHDRATEVVWLLAPVRVRMKIRLRIVLFNERREAHEAMPNAHLTTLFAGART